MSLCKCLLDVLGTDVGRTFGIVDDEVGGLDDLVSLFPHAYQPRVVVADAVLVMLAQRLLVTGGMGGDVVTGQEIGAAVVVLSL